MAKGRLNNGAPRKAVAPVKAYSNPKFLRGRGARAIRMLCEYYEPLERLNHYGIQDTVVVFGSARARPEKEVLKDLRKAKTPRMVKRYSQEMELARYYEQTVEVSARLTRWAKTIGPGRRFVITSGGGPGIMEAANRGATEGAGGISSGLAISLPLEERPNGYITPELAFEFHYFFMRKFWFAYLASGVIIFPGGYGTLDELFEILTLRYTRKIRRPLPLVLYGRKYWEEIINFDAMERWGVISPQAKKLFRVCDNPGEAVDYMRTQLLKYYRRPSPRAAP